MKFLIAFISLAVVVSFASADWATAKQRLHDAHTKCNEDPASTLPQEIVDKLQKGEKPEASDKLGAHMLCVSKHLGWQNADGTVNKDLINKRIAAHVPDVAQQQELSEKCNADQANPIATSIHLFRCIGEAMKKNAVH